MTRCSSATRCTQLPEAERPVRDDPLLRRARAHLRSARADAGAARGVAAPGGRLHVSVPNASHISLLRDLILRGTFGYQPAGHRDATHIRWFTRRDIVALVGEGGWHVEAVGHSQLHKSRYLHRPLARALDGVPGRAVVRAGPQRHVMGDSSMCRCACRSTRRTRSPTSSTVADSMERGARRAARRAGRGAQRHLLRGDAGVPASAARWTSASTAACLPAGTRRPQPRRRGRCWCSQTTTWCSGRAR